MRGGAPVFLRVIPNLTAFLLTVVTEDRGIQIEGVPQRDPGHPPQAPSHQRFPHANKLGIGQREKKPTEGVQQGKASEAQQLREQGSAAIAGEARKSFIPSGRPIESSQEDIRRGNLIVRLLRQGTQGPLENRTQVDEFEIEPEQNGSHPNRDRMVRKRKENLGVER